MNHETDQVQGRDLLIRSTAQIVSAYLGNSPTPIPNDSVATLIRTVSEALDSVGKGAVASARAEPAHTTSNPAVPIHKSVTQDYIVCLEDGKKLKMLKRHLMARYGLTPEAYRKKWGLDDDYPMTAPNYSKRRSDLAKTNGLGKGG
jgi:predicted transcriptional regulator